MRNFIGREADCNLLEEAWLQRRAGITCIYGRRRVGKSELIRIFCQKKTHYIFEAIESEDTAGQIRHFLVQLADLCNEPHLAHLNYDDWPPVFNLLTKKINLQKDLVLAFDELPWMAAGRSQLISYIKFYWDKYWKYHPHLMVILCGSIASWMVKNVVRSKALYGRVSRTLLLEPLKPREVLEFIGNKRGQNEALEYLLCFGGIPRYLEEFNFTKSIALNINDKCFTRSGFFVDEADKIFYNQFRETQLYKKITWCLMDKPMPLKDIAKAVKLPSGGGLKNYLDNLGAAKIIDHLPIIKNFKPQRHEKYLVCDEFLLFHKYFIARNLTEIRKNDAGDKFAKFTEHLWSLFLGLSFERFCLKFRYDIARLLNFENKVIGCGPIINPQPSGYQYDLVYTRTDHTITLCEVKYTNEKPGTLLIREMQQKIERTQFPKGVSLEKVLVCNHPPSKPLVEAGYFNKIIVADELMRGI